MSSSLRLSQFQRFVYSHHFVSGIRRGAGVVVAFVGCLLLTGNPNSALIAALGALCLAVIDQPGAFGVRIREMTGGMVLGALAVTFTGLASSNPILLWASVVGQTFVFSMFAVYGKRGSVIGLACLILTIVTMHTPLSPNEVLAHTLVSIGGALAYMLVSTLSSRPLQVREQEQSLSVALLSTADYIAARSDMYDMSTELDEMYRRLIACQSAMSEQHQAARDIILRSMSKSAVAKSPKRLIVWNVFIDMVNMLDMLVATHTDYALLRKTLGQSDTLIFMRDALFKMALELERIALAVTQERKLTRRNSVKAELRALEYEIETMKRDGFSQREPETYSLCIQILRRLRNVNRLVERMLSQTTRPSNADPLNPAQLDTSLSDFLSRQSFSPKLLSSNLRLDSPPFRFALRVSLAAAIGLGIGLAFPQISPHSYWIVLTIVFIMKPAFSLTKQRNQARLMGTLLGCALAFALLYMTVDPWILTAAMIASLIVGFSFMLVNYLVASVFNTLTILIVLQFLFPQSFTLVAERALDTLVGSIVAFGCSYFLPWWESRSLPSLAQAAIRANTAYLKAGITLLGQTEQSSLSASAWPLARKNMLVAFSNFAEAFYRMMGEPAAKQRQVAEFNNLLIQTHIMAAEIASTIYQLQTLPQTPPQAIAYMNSLLQALETKDLALATAPAPSESDGDTPPDWLYPLKQMQRAVLNIIRESNATDTLQTQPAT